MSTTAYMVDRFGGLNLADDPVDVGPTNATSLLNVDIAQVGRVRTRAGSSLVKSLTVDSADGFAAFETTSGTKQFVVSHTTSGTRAYEAYASTGGAAVSSAAPGNTTLNAVRWGNQTNEYLYIANGTDTIWRWDGAAFTQPAGMPTATHLAVFSSPNNRLVTANLTGLMSRVLFSDTDAPETFTYNTAPTPDTGNYVDLAPGDGSPIAGMASFQNSVFAFKKKRFFVFYGEDPDEDGQPNFHFNTFDGIGALVPPVTGDEGVYFFDGRTIWVTTGGQPVRLSRKIEPILQGTAGATFPNLDQTQLANVRLSYSLGRLYVSMPTSSSAFGYTLVYDPKIGEWTLYFAISPIKYVATLTAASTEQRYSYFYGGAAKVNRFDPALTQDAGVDIAWAWSSGFTDLGEPGRVKVTLESRAWGVGSVILAVATDYVAGTSSTLTLGTNPTVADAWQQIDREGTLWQIGLAGTAWGGVDRIAHYVSFIKPAGVQ